MPKPLSRIQLLWHRFWPPPAPANAIAPMTSAKPSWVGNCPTWVAASGSACQVPALTANTSATTTSPPMTATLTKIKRSNATYTTGARVRAAPMTSSMPMAMTVGLPPNR